MSRLVTATALAIAAAACGPQATNGGRTSTEPPGKIAGKALLVGQVDHSLITVTAIGPITRAAAVDKEGGYLFDAVPPGVYLLSASAASTLEPSASGRVAVASAQTAVAPDLKLSPIGEVTGKVLVPSGSVLGVDVVVPGTSARTTADAAGQYHLRGVATGVQTVAALRTGLEPATTQVVVQYATSITAPDLAIKGIDAGSGVITGVARFFNRTDHSGIAVAIEGTTVTTKTAADGTYTLAEVPAGYLSLVATASPYQPSRIENILSVGRGTYRAPEMKLYLGQVKFQGTVSGASIRVGPSGHALFAGAAPGSTSYYLFFLAPTDTAQPTLLSTLPVTSSGVATQFSPDGRYAAFSVDGGLHIVSIATGNPVRLADGMTSLSQVKFSPDSKRLAFIGPAETNANGTVRPLMLIDLMQLLQTRVEEVRPAASGTYCSATYWPRRLQSFVYTPDGSRLVYIAQTGTGTYELHGYEIATSNYLTYTTAEPSCFDVAGDGSRVYWQRYGTAAYELSSSPVAAAQPAVVTTASSSSYLFATGDGKSAVSIVYNGYPTYKYEFRSTPMAGGTATTLFTNSSSTVRQDPTRSKFLIYDASTARLTVVTPGSGTYAIQSLTSGASSSLSYATWSAGGRLLAVPSIYSPYRVYLADTQASADREVGTAYYYYARYYFAPDESGMVFTDTSYGSGALSYAPAAGPGAATSLGTGVFRTFTADGKRVIFTDSTGTVKVFQAGAGQPTSLGFRGTASLTPSADSSRLVAVTDGAELVSVSLGTGSPTTIDSSVAWAAPASPNGGRVVYTIATGARTGLFAASLP